MFLYYQIVACLLGQNGAIFKDIFIFLTGFNVFMYSVCYIQ